MMIAPVAVAVGILNAQSANPRPAFEVASIKRNTSGTAGESMHIQRGGRFDVQNMPVRYIIWNAYKVSDYQISGGPAWINSERYDIFAKSDSDSSPDELLLMLRTLLEDRFGLKVHRETQQGATLGELTKHRWQGGAHRARRYAIVGIPLCHWLR